MELRQLKTFQITATSASFTQASVLLGYAQSSVTVQIQSLEKELGVALFDRARRSVRLTAAGEKLLVYANRLLDLAAEAQAVVSDQGRLEGSLSIAAPETICTYRLPALIRQFRDSHPDVRISFQPMLDRDIYFGVRNGVIDFGFLLQEPLQTDGLLVESLVKEPLFVIGAPSAPQAALARVSPADLEGETLILTENGCGYRHLFEREMAKAGVYATIRLEFNSVEAIKQCVISGLGFGFLPRVGVDREIAEGQLCALRWAKPFNVYTQLVYRKDKWLSQTMQDFISLCRNRLPGKSGINHPETNLRSGLIP
jgi:DNA-binding transcriptional LysR family regulator